MSTDSLERNSGEDGHLTLVLPGHNGSGSSGDVDDTPRSEAPPTLDVTTPRTSEAATTTTAHSLDYFRQPPTVTAAAAAAEEPRPPLESARASTEHSTSTAPGFSSSHANDLGDTQPPGSAPPSDALLSPRPTTQQTPSSVSIETVESTDSTATVKRERPPFLPPSGTSFPDQSFAALHHQDYSTYKPAYMRDRNPAPYSPVANFTTAIASHHQTGSRTAQSSPAVTPSYGLFSPSSTAGVRS